MMAFSRTRLWLLLLFSFMFLAKVVGASYDNIGQIVPVDLGDEKTINEFKGIVTLSVDEKKTSYNGEAVLSLLAGLPEIPNVELIGFKLRNEAGDLDEDFAGFGILERINKVKHVATLFTHPKKRNFGFGSILTRFVANENDNGVVNYLSISRLRTAWVERFVVNQLNERAQSDIEAYLKRADCDRNVYEQMRIVQGLRVTYGDIEENAKSHVAEYLAQKFINVGLYSRAADLAQYFVTDFAVRPKMLMFTGQPGAGKGYAYKELAERWFGLNGFRMVDIDNFVEPALRKKLQQHGWRSFEQIEPDQRDGFIKEVYDQEWPRFENFLQKAIDSGDDIALFVTGRQTDLVRTYRMKAPEHEIIVVNITAKPEVLTERINARAVDTGRWVPQYFQTQCAKEIPHALHHHMMIEKVPTIVIENDGTMDNPQALKLVNITNHGKRLVDDNWRFRVGEPTRWLFLPINEENEDMIRKEFRAVIYGVTAPEKNKE